jgi:N-hydroxyarylamine O-acetyltransferase
MTALATAGIDLAGYFRRIGYSGDVTPTLDVLRAIQLAHTQSIAFENLDPLLGRPVRLDARSLEEKLLLGGRGGYCFEQNTLLRHVLEAIGFRVTGLAARVLWGAPEAAITARGHMLLRVDVDETPYIVDAGFGLLTPTGPVRLEPHVAQVTPHEPFRLLPVGDDYLMQGRTGDAWRTLYRFGLEEHFPADYEVTNWYLSHNPASHFVTGLIAARSAPGRRFTLRNTDFAIHYLKGRTERRVLRTAAELRETLAGPFGLTLPDAPELDATLARLAAQPA